MTIDVAKKLCFYEEVARRKLGVGADWRWSSLKSVGPDTLVEGGVPKIISRGKNKGRPSWRGTKLDACAVTETELIAERARFEVDAGYCWQCQGSGKEVVRVSTEGTTYGSCRRCAGSGSAPQKTAEVAE